MRNINVKFLKCGIFITLVTKHLLSPNDLKQNYLAFLRLNTSMGRNKVFSNFDDEQCGKLPLGTL